MTDPIRSALKRLLSAVLDGLGQDDHPMGWARVDDAIDAARAALAEPVAAPAEPTDDELWDIGERHLWTGTDESVTNYRILSSFITAARAVLSRYGHQPAPLAEPEVEGPTDEELLELWQGWNLGWDPQKGMVLMPHPAEYARAVLTRWGRAGLADGPAVPDGRESASVVGEPSDDELLGIAAQAIEPYDKISLGEYEAENNCAIEVYTSELIAFARAVLARYGHQPAPPDEGNVAELALKELERTVVLLMPVTGKNKIKRFDTIRAALKRLHELENKADLSPAPPAPKPADGELGDEDLGEPLGDLIDKWCQEGMQVKPHGTSFPLAHYVASKAYQYGLRKGRPAPAPAGELLKEAAWLRNECSAENADGNWISMSIDQALDLASLLERQAAPVSVPAVAGEAAHIRRMCDIILGSAFGNEELDSLALLVGHHPDVLNASPAPVEGEVEP